MVGADTLLLYRILPFDKTLASLVRSTGGAVSGGIEVHLIQVETGTSLFRQTVTAKTVFPPPTVAAWTEEEVIRAHGIVSEEAAAYAFSALAASVSTNPLGVVPAVNEVGLVWGVLSSSPSDTAGFKKRDKIIQVNNRPFTAWTDRIELPATITVMREGKELRLSVSSR
jgi:S1-C subfamily serine protease